MVIYSRPLWTRALLLLSMLSALLAFSAAGAQEQQVEVSVDRSELARGETLTYTIRVFAQRQGMQLDLTPLTDDFDVLGTRTSSQIRSINGSVESWTDYIVTLFPLTEGDLTIPSLTINNAQTDPISINVINAGPRSNQSSDELFLEIELNKETVYVQEQLLFTIRLYYTINGIRNPQFTELEMPDTVIQLIGSPNQYEKLIEGQRYGVYEKRYVIFPQRSGPLAIPDILFRGEVTDGSSNFVFRNLNTRRVTAFIDGITIDVAERPEAARDDGVWLPVTNLSLEESWDTDISNLKIGDSVVRTITMVADGLDGAVLPPFSPDQIDGLNLYPEPPEIQRTFVDGNIVGTRIETTTLVPVTDGEIVIPQISIPWWNVNSDQSEVTVIPATRINIAAISGDVPAEQTVTTSANIEELLAAPPVVDQTMIDEQAEAELIQIDTFWLYLAIALALLLVAFSVYQFVVAPNRHLIRAYVSHQRSRLAEHYSAENSEHIAFKQLLAANRGNDLNRVREALITWCQHYLSGRKVLTMEDILQQREAPELHPFANRIQAGLFDHQSDGQVNTSVDGQGLSQLVTDLRRRRRQADRRQRRTARYALPPLYKT